MSKKNILVCDAGGFIGGHLITLLLSLKLIGNQIILLEKG